jgi:hypothetical protein
LIFGTGLAFSGATASIACGTKLDNCETTSTCSAPRNTGGSGGSHAEAGAPADEGGGSGGKGGHGGTSSAGNQGGKGGGGGSSDTSTHAGSPGAGVAGSDDVAPHDDDHQHGDVHHGDGGESGEGGEGGTPSDGPASGGGRSGSPGHASAGQGNSAGAGSGGTSGQGADTTPPSVTSVSPQNETTGVKNDAEISVTFSETMDMASVQAAYTSSDLPAGSVDFSWQTLGTVLVVHPKAPLTYADVTAPTAAAKHYSFTIGAGAKDVAGNALGVERTFGFTTLRHVTQVLNVKSGGGVVLTHPESGPDTTAASCDGAGAYVSAGEDKSNGAILSLVAFDLSSLPASIVEWQSAVLTSALSLGAQRNPFSTDRLGVLHLYSTQVAPSMLSWDAPMSDLGIFASYASQTDGNLSVLDAIGADFAQRVPLGNTSEYVFHFDIQTDGANASTTERLFCSDLRLTLEYLAP